MATSNTPALHHNVLLSAYAQAWTPPQDLTWYLADELFRPIPVDKETNDYKIINQSTYQQLADTIVGADGDVAEVQFYVDLDGTYKAKAHALDGVIDHLERQKADDILEYEKRQADVPLTVLTNTLEYDAMQVVRNTANLGTSYRALASDELFDNYSSLDSNPVLILREACEAIISAAGRLPNFMAIDFLVWRAMKFNPAVQAIAPVHTMPAGLQEITVEMLEKKLEDVLRPKSIRITYGRYETARGPVLPANSKKKSWLGSDVVIAFNQDVSRSSLGAAQQFRFTGQNAGDESIQTENPGSPIGIYTFPAQHRGQKGSTIVRAITNRDYRVTRTSSLFVLKQCVDITNTTLYRNELD